jgi:hypothetical protein
MAVWLERMQVPWLVDGAIVLSLILNGLTVMTLRDVGSQSNPWIVVGTAYVIVALARRGIIPRLRTPVARQIRANPRNR